MPILEVHSVPGTMLDPSSMMIEQAEIVERDWDVELDI